MTTPACIASHMGLYACEPKWLRRQVAEFKARRLPMLAAEDVADAESYDGPGYRVESGVAVIRIEGGITKGFSKFGGASAVFTRRSIRAAVADPKVSSILLKVYSPGGNVDGVPDLASDVEAANEQKPVVAFIEDMGASAAYWIASQAGKVYANPTAFIGSIGVLAVVYDTSKAAEAAGVDVHVLSTGPLKGAGVDGAPITDEMLTAWQGEVDAIMGFFEKAVRRGRGMTQAQFGKVSTGGVWIAAEAQALGLIDGVKSLDAVLAGMPRPRKARTA